MAEDDMKSGMMAMLKTMLPEEPEPTNVVAKFIQAEMIKVLDESDEAGVMSAIFVDVANNHPKDVLKSLIEVYNDIGEFVVSLTEISVSGEHEALDNPDFVVVDDTAEIEDDDPGPEGEPELDDTIDETNEPNEIEEAAEPEVDEVDEPESDDSEEFKKDMAALLAKYKKK